jgi:uncharacterized SAM-binding protein YcdF (DUF218 family)
VFGWVRLRRRGRYGALVAAFFLLFLASWPPADWLFSRPLEARYPIRPFASEPVEATVVLSASVEPAHYERPFALPGSGTVERCRYAAWIHQRLRNLPVLACGGGTPLPASRARAELLREKGVPEALIWTEERSPFHPSECSFWSRDSEEARHPPGCLSGGGKEHAAR